MEIEELRVVLPIQWRKCKTRGLANAVLSLFLSLSLSLSLSP
eukprot:COSAG03_NODE_4046_length_1708_cov_1.722809_1_plen_41_part_10